MSETQVSFLNYLQINVSPTLKTSPELRVEFQSAPEKPVIGQPGKQVGDVLLTNQADGTRLAIVSLGKSEKHSAETFRQAGGGLARWLLQSGASSVDIEMEHFNDFGVANAVPALCEGLYLGAFRFTRRKSKPEDAKLVTVTLRVPTKKDVKAIQPQVERARIICNAVNLAREWSHEPPNVINPITLSERAAQMALQFGLKCTILDDEQLVKMGAGAILAVGKGSSTPARLIVLEYAGQNTDPDSKPVVFIGKALTFDTGGYSLKGVENIVGMKYDKCGGLAVIAALCAAAELKIKNRVVGIIGAAENRIAPHSYLPDDIITTLSGQTVEIISTDAEGRMVLADCLTYAQQNLNPAAMIDLATLTGGVIVALGRVRAGLMSNNDELSQRLITAGDMVHERLWRLPLDEDYVKNIKGDDSDWKNSGGREAHSIIGGTFLQQFVSDEIPWAHLDIAGMADTPKELPYCPKGGTGFGVRLLIEYLENLE